MDKSTIKDLALIYVRTYAPRDLTPEQFVDFFNETMIKMTQHYDAHEELHPKWNY